MAVDSNALTLAEYALISNDQRVMEVTSSLLDNGSVMARDIPFVNRATLIMNGVRWEGNLPTVDWVQLNSEGAVTKGTPQPYQEQAYLFRNKIQVDKFLMLDENQISNPMQLQVAAYARAQAYDFNDKFINNNHQAGDANAIVGLRARLDNPDTYGILSANKIDADADLSPDATAAQVNAFLEKLDELLWAVDSPDGSGVVLYHNEVLGRRIAFALRSLGATGGLDQNRDQFDRVFTTYKNAVLRDVGYKADQTTRIITTTENEDGTDGSSNNTSIYAVNYGMDHLIGWQFAPMYVSPPEMTEGGAVFQTLIDWMGGFMTRHIRSIGRLYDILLV